MNNPIKERLTQVLNQVAKAAEDCGRGPHTVRLLAVSKRHPVEAILEAYNAGQMAFGESYAQELVEKAEACAEVDGLQFEYIGPIQSNKVKLIVGNCRLIHAIDRPKVLRYVSRQAVELGIEQDILLEVHISPEPSKHGCRPENLPGLLELAVNTPGVNPRGLMAMPPYTEDPEGARPYFRQLRVMRDQLKEKFQLDSFNELSMGMSHDFKVAIEEGSSIVRIGTAIFGERD